MHSISSYEQEATSSIPSQSMSEAGETARDSSPNNLDIIPLAGASMSEADDSAELGAPVALESLPAQTTQDPDDISLQDLQAKAVLSLIQEARDRFATTIISSVSLVLNRTSRPTNLCVLWVRRKISRFSTHWRNISVPSMPPQRWTLRPSTLVAAARTITSQSSRQSISKPSRTYGMQ